MASLADQPVSPPSTTLNPRTVPAAPPRPQPAAPGTAQAAETVAALSQPEPETRSRRKPAAARPPLPAQAVASATPAPAPSGLNQGRSGENACGELTSNPLSQSSADKVAAQYAAAIKIPEQQAIRGDLVFFRTDDGSSVDHVGIYLGNNKFVHAPGAGKSITTDSLTDTWKVQFAGFGRLPASCRASIIPQP
ncbi:MAG: C40 family peptidase [Thiothrix sp.]|nr:C40 family peptidase [Thiothrix sp.]HPQ96006.1 NlpC/P60 family protein [Thiolinea sp.]